MPRRTRDTLDDEEQQGVPYWADDAHTFFGPHGIRVPIVYALFITMCGALLSTSGAPWLLVVSAALVLVIGCMRAAVLAEAAEAAHQESEDAALGLTEANNASSMLALLRAGRVVVVPGRLPSDDLELSRAPVNERAMLAQLATQLSYLRSRVVAATSANPQVQPVTDDDLNSLPTSTWPHGSKAWRQPSAQLDSTTVPSSTLPQTGPGTGGRVGSTAVHGAKGLSGKGGLASVDSGEASGPVCTICLEEFAAGDKTMTLPCFHFYHDTCIRDWLQKQGRHVGCPVCKTPVFM